MIGLIATKEGMTRVFHENGESIPVSVIKVDPNIVSQIKNEETDGYSAVQLSSDDRKEKNVIKPNKGHFSKNKINTKNNIHEFRVTSDSLAEIEIGKEFSVNNFEEGQFVEVSGISKGKGFAGVMKRHGFGGGRRTRKSNNRGSDLRYDLSLTLEEAYLGKTQNIQFSTSDICISC